MAEQFAVPVKVSQRFLDDLVSTAFEGGINYWCTKAEPGTATGALVEGADYLSDVITRGGTVYLYDDDPSEGSGKTYALTLDKLLNGLALYIDRNLARSDGIPDVLDANGADQVIQYAVFGEVIYG